MTYALFSELNVTANNGKQLITGLNKTSLLIELNTAQTFQNGDLIERAYRSGRRFGVRWIQGNVKGFLNPLEYGQNEILLDVSNPLELFDVEIVPDRYQFEYNIKIYIKQFNPRFLFLAERLGITLEVLQAFPEQTLLFLEGFIPMANTDTRTTNAKLEALDAKAEQALQTGQTAQTTAQSTADSLTQAKTEMVLNREFELTSAMFALENGFRVADVTHDLTGSKPDMSLTDAQGDDQGFAQLISKSPTVVRVELSPTQWTDNSYPMFLTLQGLKGSATVGAFKLMTGTLTSFNKASGVLSRYVDGVGATAMASNVEWAFIEPVYKTVAYKLQNQSCFLWDEVTQTQTTLDNQSFDLRASAIDVIVLD